MPRYNLIIDVKEDGTSPVETARNAAECLRALAKHYLEKTTLKADVMTGIGVGNVKVSIKGEKENTDDNI